MYPGVPSAVRHKIKIQCLFKTAAVLIKMQGLLQDMQRHCCRFLSVVDRNRLAATCAPLRNIQPVDYHCFPLDAHSLQLIFKEWLYVVKPRKRVRGWSALSWRSAPRRRREDILLF